MFKSHAIIFLILIMLVSYRMEELSTLLKAVGASITNSLPSTGSSYVTANNNCLKL